MAYERTSDSKIEGDSLDAFVSNLSKSFSNQVAVRNAEDESRFNTAVLESNISLDAQLQYRQDQLNRVSDDPAEKARVKSEISSLKDRIEQKKFSDAWTDKLIEFESGSTSVDSVITFLNSQKSVATDQGIIDAINKQLVSMSQQKFELTSQMITNQTQFALNDKSESVIGDAVTRITNEKNKALLSGNATLASNYDLQLQALTKAKTENGIEKEIKNFAVSSITGYATATKLLDSYNAKISGSAVEGPVKIGDVTYSSAQEFWTFKRDSYLADSSNSGFFGRLADEMDTQLKSTSSKNALTAGQLQAITSPVDGLVGRPELVGYEAKIDYTKQAAMQTGANLLTDKITNEYSVNYDISKAVNSLNVLKASGVNVDDAYAKVINAGANVKQGQVNNILQTAQQLMADEGLSPDAALTKAIARGAGVVLSPEELATQSEKDIAGAAATGAKNESFGIDARTTIQKDTMAVPGATPTPGKTSTYTGGSIVDYLGSVGQASDFASRKKLAEQNGITNYSGSATQNTQLLGLVQKNTNKTNQPIVTAPAVKTNAPTNIQPTPAQPKPTGQVPVTPVTPRPVQPIKPNTPSPTPASVVKYNGNSVVDFLGSVGQASDYSSRKKLAEQNGIKNYSGSAAQNTQLLGIIKTKY
jgi:hypothetical protein